MKDLNPGYREPGYLFVREAADDLRGPLVPLSQYDLENWEEVYQVYKPALITHDRLLAIGFTALASQEMGSYLIRRGNLFAVLHYDPTRPVQCHYFFSTETGNLYVKYIHQLQYVLNNWFKIKLL